MPDGPDVVRELKRLRMSSALWVSKSAKVLDAAIEEIEHLRLVNQNLEGLVEDLMSGE